MEVILLERIRNLGVLGDKVVVKNGYARNYLVPQGKAVYATADNLKEFEARRAELEKQQAERHAAALSRQEKINALPVIIIKAKASDEGKLFGSVSVRDIVDAITAAGTEVEKREVNLADAIRSIGEYDVSVELESDVVAQVKVVVEAE